MFYQIVNNRNNCYNEKNCNKYCAHNYACFPLFTNEFLLTIPYRFISLDSLTNDTLLIYLYRRQNQRTERTGFMAYSDDLVMHREDVS
jgi:hypothetical protein